MGTARWTLTPVLPAPLARRARAPPPPPPPRSCAVGYKIVREAVCILYNVLHLCMWEYYVRDLWL
jgi:hypothetical protein